MSFTEIYSEWFPVWIWIRIQIHCEREFFYRTEMDLNQTASLWHHFLNEQVIGYEARCILWILNSKKRRRFSKQSAGDS